MRKEFFELPLRDEEMLGRDPPRSSGWESAKLEEMMKQEFFPLDTTPIKYIYRPIGIDEDIRLFYLRPGGRNHPIRGNLVHVSFSAKPGYEALSYTWGSDIKPHEILTDEGAIPITTSLQSALARLRFPDRVRVLWVDALCINQKSDEENGEKSEQILLMPKIYSSASKVVVHLGPEAAGSDKVLDLLDRVARTNFSALSHRYTLSNSLSIAALPETGDKRWIPFRTFWRRPWFRRVWIVQEFLLGKDVTFICGEWEKDLDAFIEAAVKSYEYGLIGRSDPYADGDELGEAHAGVTAMARLGELRAKRDPIMGISLKQKQKAEAANEQLLLRNDHLDISVLSEWRRTVVGMLEELANLDERLAESAPDLESPKMPGGMSLLSLIDFTQGSQATDPRDRLFALLSLTNDLSKEDLELLRPNYNKPIEWVVRRYAWVLIRKGQSMDILYRAFFKPEVPCLSRLPSWVGDWIGSIMPSQQSWLGVDGSEIYSAGGTSIPKVRMGSREDVLVVSGSLVGVISRVGKGAVIREDLGLLFPLAVNLTLDEADLIFNSVSPYPTGESIFDVKWQTLIANKTAEENTKAPEQYGMQYLIWRKLIKGMVLAPTPQQKMDMSPPEVLGYFHSLVVVQNYKVGRTSGGYVGLVPLAAEVGDVIAVFEGGRVPFVLRGSVESPGMYRLVGGCYVHGMMNGEAFRLPYANIEDIHLH